MITFGICSRFEAVPKREGFWAVHDAEASPMLVGFMDRDGLDEFIETTRDEGLR